MASVALREKVRLRQEVPAPATARALRVASGLTLSDIAYEVGVTPGCVCHWELGRRRPRADLLDRYLAVIRVLREAA